MELTKADFEAGKVFTKNNDNHTEIQYRFEAEKSTSYVGWIFSKFPEESEWQLFGHVTEIDDHYIKFDYDIFYDYWIDIAVEYEIFKLVST